MGLFSSIGGILGGAVGSIFGPVGTVIGSGLGGSVGGAVDSNQANKKAEGYYNQQMNFAKEQFQFQQDYAKNVAQWRVEDAKKAGLHPMAALGISSPSFSPVSSPSSPSYSTGADIDPMEFGQSLNYAATKAKDLKQQQAMFNVNLQGAMLDNEYKQALIDNLKVDTLASTIASNQAFNSPPAPSLSPSGLVPGQSGSLLTDPTPMQITPHTAPGKEPGSNPSVGWLANPDGSVITTQSSQAKNKLEEDLVGTILWNVSNRLVPHVKHMFGYDVSQYAPPVELLPKGASGWMYSGAGEWLPVDANGRSLVNRLDIFRGAKSPRMKQWFNNFSKVTY